MVLAAFSKAACYLSHWSYKNGEVTNADSDNKVLNSFQGIFFVADQEALLPQIDALAVIVRSTLAFLFWLHVAIPHCFLSGSFPFLQSITVQQHVGVGELGRH
jgi:hypothetical protein